MDLGDRVTLKATVRHDVGDGVYAVDIPSYPARHSTRQGKKLKLGAELLLMGEVVRILDDRVTVALDSGGKVTVLIETLERVERAKTHPKLFDKRRP
jgi:hypothetical protein